MISAMTLSLFGLDRFEVSIARVLADFLTLFHFTAAAIWFRSA
jgi:hypothetical protein